MEPGDTSGFGPRRRRRERRARHGGTPGPIGLAGVARGARAESEREPSRRSGSYASGRQPAVALLSAILEDALHCAQGPGRGVTHRMCAEATAWIRSERRDDLCAFASICEVLGIDAAAIRARIGTPGPVAGHRTAAPVAALRTAATADSG